MTDTTFFIDTKAAFEHAFKAGAFTKTYADDFMYMHSSVLTPKVGHPTSWVDRFKHRDTRKYTNVTRHTFIAPSEPARRPDPGAKSADRIKEITEARAEFNRLEKCRDAAPQLLKALVNLSRCIPPNPVHPDWKIARAEAVTACEAAGWRSGEEI